jgi:hypothetical protein
MLNINDGVISFSFGGGRKDEAAEEVIAKVKGRGDA